ncbi:MAG: hypothetical protein P8Y94_02235, partial [Acidobacteriota bacterium]
QIPIFSVFNFRKRNNWDVGDGLGHMRHMGHMRQTGKAVFTARRTRRRVSQVSEAVPYAPVRPIAPHLTGIGWEPSTVKVP